MKRAVNPHEERTLHRVLDISIVICSLVAMCEARGHAPSAAFLVEIMGFDNNVTAIETFTALSNLEKKGIIALLDGGYSLLKNSEVELAAQKTVTLSQYRYLAEAEKKMGEMGLKQV